MIESVGETFAEEGTLCDQPSSGMRNLHAKCVHIFEHVMKRCVELSVAEERTKTKTNSDTATLVTKRMRLMMSVEATVRNSLVDATSFQNAC